MKRVMLDIETLGKGPGAVVFSIGAVMLDGEEQLDGFYITIDPRDAERRGLRCDADTVGWWLRQNEAARAELSQAFADGMRLEAALGAFGGWYAKQDAAEVWCKGASFDFPVLEAAFAAAAVEVPWKYYQQRCYRTVAALWPGDASARPDMPHHARSDAEAQAKHLVLILRNTGKLSNKPAP